MSSKKRTKKAQTPHDALVKHVFGDPALAAEFIGSALPPEVAGRLDLTRLTATPSHLVDDGLDPEVRSDFLFRTKLEGRRDALVFVLVEHQSKVDPEMPWRLLRYVFLILQRWRRERKSRNEPTRPMPAILPIVLYHGHNPWGASVDLEDMFDIGPDDLEHIGPYLPRLRVFVDDLAQETDETLRHRALSAYVLLMLAALKHARHDEDSERFWSAWADVTLDLLRAPNGAAALAVLMRYHLLVRPELDRHRLIERIESLGPVARNTMKSIADALIEEGREEGRVEGRVEGREEGRVEGAAKVLLNQIELKFGPPSDEVRARVVAATEAELVDWSGRILRASTIDELFETP